MGYYSRGMHTDRSSGGRVWRILLLPILVFGVLALLSFAYCNRRVDRVSIRRALDGARQAATVAELDRALLPTFEKMAKGEGRIEYVAHPLGSGLCACALVTLDTVEVRVDAEGDVTQMSAYQTLGMSVRRR